MKHINKIAGIQGGDFVLRLTARKLGAYAEEKLFILRENVF